MGASLKRAGGRGRHRPMGEINVTPFVDVMLVLLIVFMVTAPLLTVGVEVDLPKTKPVRSMLMRRLWWFQSRLMAVCIYRKQKWIRSNLFPG